MPAGQLDGGRHVAPRGDAAENPLLAREALRHFDRLIRRRRYDAGEQRQVKRPGHEAVPDALDAVRPPAPLAQERALLRLHGVELHVRVVLAQEFPHAAHPAARSLRRHDGVDAPVQLLENLRSCREVVRLVVVEVVELGGNPVFPGQCRADLFEFFERQVNVALPARREHQIGPVGAHELFSLIAHPLGHDDDAGIPLHRGYERAGDACVAGGAFEHRHAGPQAAALLRFQNHVVVDAILEAPRWRIPLQLRVDLGAQVRRHLVQANQGRTPDGVENVFRIAPVGIPGSFFNAHFLHPKRRETPHSMSSHEVLNFWSIISLSPSTTSCSAASIPDSS